MSLNVRFRIKKFFDHFFWGQHPETALRYLPVVTELKKAKLENAKILEVGSGALGITPYFKKKIDGLDLDFSGQKSDLVNKIKGSILNYPLRKNSYDVVICVDVLEHLKKSDRQEAINTLLKVARKMIVIVVPVGQLSEQQDKQLDDYFRQIFGYHDQFLREHVQNGLPQPEEILVYLDRAQRSQNKIAKVKSSAILNLSIRNLLMKTWISKNKLFYYLYLKGYLLLLPLLQYANFGHCYRRIFIVELTPQGTIPNR